jgi:hypothetical protein
LSVFDCQEKVKSPIAYKLGLAMAHHSRYLVPLIVLENALLPQSGYYHLPSMPARLPPSPPYAARSSSPSDPRSPQSDTSSPSEQQHNHKCEWADCTNTYIDPETLYGHLCNDHIGRKSTNNLCLTCKWKDCGTVCAKRDHITSHLRGMSLQRLSPIRYSSYDSTHSSKASCLRGATLHISSRTSLGSHINFYRSATRLSSDPRTSKSTRKYIPKNTTHNISTPRQSLSPTQPMFQESVENRPLTQAIPKPLSQRLPPLIPGFHLHELNPIALLGPMVSNFFLQILFPS